MVLDSFVYSSKGGRAYNEDFAGSRSMSGGGVFVIADGLGGHRHGELASKCVADTLLAEEPAQEDDLPVWLQQRIQCANEKLLGLQKEKNSNMKSTAVVLAVRGEKASWAHVGDSRLYYFHQSGIAAITDDHSVAYKKYKAGEITRAQIGQDPDQPCLLRTVGSAGHFQPDVASCSGSLAGGDAFLLCTDGVWEYMRDEEALIDLLKADSAKQWAELILLRVMERIEPENDNLSLITVLVR